MIRAGLAALLSHWWRSPLQLAMLLLGLSLATALWSGVQAINAEARASYARAAETLGQDQLSRLVADRPIPQETYVTLRRAGWLVSPVVEGRLAVGPRSLRLIGIDPLSLPSEAQQVEFGEGDALLPFVTPPGLLYVNAETQARLERADNLPPLRLSESLPPGTALTDIGQAQRLLGVEGTVSHLLIHPGSPQPSLDPALGLVVQEMAQGRIREV